MTTIGLAVKLVSAILNEESCPEPDIRSSKLGITEGNFNDVFEQLKGKVVKTSAIAKVLM
ncbi:MAG: hypothetical protein GY763_09415 [Gammaproteobacteria bacterium]|nr:hypothetical protein [Gammaproteobacteria bacterium]